MGPLESSPDGHHDESLLFLITAQDVCEEVCHISKDAPMLRFVMGFRKKGKQDVEGFSVYLLFFFRADKQYPE